MMIPREFVGKKFPRFKVNISEQPFRLLLDLIQPHDSEKITSWPPPSNWPAVMVLHGTACLINVWEELGVDPLRALLAREEFHHIRSPAPDEELTGWLWIEDIREFVDEDGQISDQVDFAADFCNAAGVRLADYHFTYRITMTSH